MKKVIYPLRSIKKSEKYKKSYLIYAKNKNNYYKKRKK